MSKRTGGFRFSGVDALAILAASVGCFWMQRLELGAFAALPAVVLGHFFLFCNIFRVHRYAELIWATLFLANFGYWAFLASFNWFYVLGVQTPVTLAVILHALRAPWYHGIGFQRINPKWREYLAG